MKPTNPSAFPKAKWDGPNGMTLRDWFAGQSMLAQISNSHTAKCYQDAGIVGDRVAPCIAINAYKMADAMLEQREKAEQ